MANLDAQRFSRGAVHRHSARWALRWPPKHEGLPRPIPPVKVCTHRRIVLSHSPPTFRSRGAHDVPTPPMMDLSPISLLENGPRYSSSVHARTRDIPATARRHDSAFLNAAAEVCTCALPPSAVTHIPSSATDLRVPPFSHGMCVHLCYCTDRATHKSTHHPQRSSVIPHSPPARTSQYQGPPTCHHQLRLTPGLAIQERTASYLRESICAPVTLGLNTASEVRICSPVLRLCNRLHPHQCPYCQTCALCCCAPKW